MLVSRRSLSIVHWLVLEQSSQESDYTTMFIPYGPKWDRERTRRHVLNYVSSANSWYYRLNVRYAVYFRGHV